MTQANEEDLLTAVISVWAAVKQIATDDDLVSDVVDDLITELEPVVAEVWVRITELPDAGASAFAARVVCVLDDVLINLENLLATDGVVMMASGPMRRGYPDAWPKRPVH